MSLHPRKIETRYTSKICTIQKIMIHSEENKIKVGVDVDWKIVLGVGMRLKCLIWMLDA